ncbi:MAG: hypothetical protein K6T83_08215 [Alicyclobacillus sp.]|nr:hypothetical protein [Alicyclobacillus sp.]
MYSLRAIENGKRVKRKWTSVAVEWAVDAAISLALLFGTLWGMGFFEPVK